MSLDALVEDIDIDSLPSSKPSGQAKKTPTTSSQTKSAPEKDTRLVSTEIKPFLASSANVPKEFREKWTKMNKIDIQANKTTNFLPSHAYRGWDTAPGTGGGGVSKCLHELVKAAATTCDFNEIKTAKLLSLVNPVTDSEHGKQLQAAFFHSVIQDLGSEITSDSNYDPTKFANLARVMGESG